ncbi:MAG: helix-hairpin-helix domain-containing protein, partial [Pseudomonadota bacterium]
GGEETLFVGPEQRPVVPGGDSAASHLIQNIRDEAHRFAITGHRQRRAKKRQTSVLEEVSGIGATRRRQILQHFGGLKGVRRAGVEELCAVEGISAELAQRIYDALHD